MFELPDTAETVWIKGRIEDGKAKFASGEPACVMDVKETFRDGRDSIYTLTYKYYTVSCKDTTVTQHLWGTRYLYLTQHSMVGLSDDWEAECDITNKTLKSSNKLFAFSYFENAEETFTHRFPYNGPIMENIFMGLMHDEPSVPAKPKRFQIVLANRFGGFKIIADPIDNDGKMINPDKLYYRIHINENAQNPECVKSYWEGHYLTHPFFYQWGSSDDLLIEECYAVMVYKDDDVEYESEPVYLGPSDLAEMMSDAEVKGDQLIYDLTGRPVKCDKLVPGLYIRAGKKFIVK